MNVAIAAMIAGRLRRRRRDHAVTRIHDNVTQVLDDLTCTRRPRHASVSLTCEVREEIQHSLTAAAPARSGVSLDPAPHEPYTQSARLRPRRHRVTLTVTFSK